MPLVLSIDAVRCDAPSPPDDGPWQIGQVLHELLDRYQLDLAKPPVCPVHLDFVDHALTMC